MDSVLLNAVSYIKNISKKKVTLARIETFMRKLLWKLLSYKEDNIIYNVIIYNIFHNVIDSLIKNGFIKVNGDEGNGALELTNTTPVEHG